MGQECLVNMKSENKFVNLCDNTVCTSDNNSSELGENMALLFHINDSVDCKYINTSLSKQLRKYLNGSLKPRTKHFSEWKMQSDFDFGFVPVSDLVLSQETHTYPIHNACPIQLHKCVRESTSLNFLKCRIPPQSQLNIDQWQKELQGYWDVQLIDLLRFGFPLDFSRNCVLKWEDKNHTSAVQYPEDVHVYLNEEIQHGAIIGSFESSPINGCHISLFMTCEKSN